MYVYGIPCDGEHAGATYLAKYGLLIFPAYTQATYLQNHTMEALNPRFLERFQAIMDHKGPLRVDLEDPYITEEEYTLVKKLGLCSWYYIPM